MVAVLFAITAFIISANVAIQQPWLGVTLAPHVSGVVVENVDQAGPSAGILFPQDVIMQLSDIHGNGIQLQSQDIIEDPDSFPTLAERNVFRERQGRIYSLVLQPVVVLTLDDGRVVRIQPGETTPLLSFPFSFWILTLYAVVALLVGAALWSVRQHSVPARYLLLSGVGATILLNAVKIIALRELALDAALYPWATFYYHLGNNLFALGMIGLVWHFPRDLGRFPIISLLVTYMSFFMLNEYFEWLELPGNTVLIQVPAYIVTSMIIMGVQWFRSRDNPVDRATVKALILMIWILIFAISGTYFTNVVLLNSPRMSLTGSFFGMFFVYIMLALAIVRYRLFDVDRWWMEIWLWFFAGLAIIAVDMLLVVLIGLAPPYALGLSVVVGAWLYFPVRQWLWGRLFYRTQYALEAYVPLLVRHFVQVERSGMSNVWMKVLEDVFRPVSIQSKNESITETEIVENGSRLLVPCLQDGCCMDLQYAEKGRRLFNSQDVKLAQSLFNISRASVKQRESYLNGMQDERKRIMRDLHDDVGGRLLTITHSAQGDLSSVAIEALKRLREIIYSLDSEQKLTLDEAIAKWRIEALERCELADVAFVWHWSEVDEEIFILPRHSLNLTLILREALSNVFSHANATQVIYSFKVVAGELHLEIANDGVAPPRGEMRLGKGLQNMRFRIEELRGVFEHHNEAGNFSVRAVIPLIKDIDDA